ncbi:MAG: electron transfer flavoprotein subunit beta/FixA family protein [Candidatus Velthaea sp.]
MPCADLRTSPGSSRPGLLCRVSSVPEAATLKIVVTVKLVPDTNADKRIDPGTKRLVRTGVETVLNPFDEYAIEAALQLRDARNDGSTVTIFTMAPESGKEIVRKALAMGADGAVMLSDPGFEGSDVWGTAYALAAGIKNAGFDLVFTGTQSTDAQTGELPGALAEYLGVPGLTYAREIAVDGARVRIKRETDTGYQTVSAPLPALVSVTKSANEPRYPSLKGIMGAKKKEIKMMSLADLALDKPVGTAGAKTELLELAAPPVRGKGQTVTAADAVDGARRIVQFLKEKKLL